MKQQRGHLLVSTDNVTLLAQGYGGLRIPPIIGRADNQIGVR